MKASQKDLGLLLTSMLVLATVLVIPAANADNTIIIGADGSLSPTDAPITRNGDTYTLVGNVSEPIEIQRNNTLFDGQDHSIQGTTSSQGISLTGTKNVTVRNTRISGFLTGIKLGPSVENTVANVRVTNCTYGIVAHRSLRAKITNNTVQSNKWDGIFITASPDSQITNNKVDNNGKWGIYLGFSSDCTLNNNQMTDNAYNFGVSVDFIQDIDTSNTVNGKPIIFWVDKRNAQIPADAGYLAIVNSHSIEARNLHLTNNGQGITLVNSADTHIENCNITGNAYYGIALIDSTQNTLSNNTITRSSNGVGITLVSSTSNSVTNNTIKSNDTGIYLQTSSENYIHHNNFINNTRHADTQDSISAWDDDYPSGGNYWSNYEGKDANNDGIGDTPYTIDANNKDKYPLMTPVIKMPFSRDPLTSIIPFLIVSLMIIMITPILIVLCRSKKSKEHILTKLCKITSKGKS